MPPVGFEPTISAGKLPQTYALDRAATGTGIQKHIPTTYWYIRRAVSDAAGFCQKGTRHAKLCTCLSHAMKTYAELDVKLDAFLTLIQLLHGSD